MNKHFDSLKIAELISRHIQNKLSREESLKLEQWLQDNPRNKSLFDRITSEEAIRKKLEQYEDHDLNKAWKEITKKKTREEKTKVLSIGKLVRYAAILVPLLIGGYFLFLKNQTGKKSTTIIAGTQKALLTLGNGEKLLLSPPDEDTIIHDHKLAILHAGSTLDYQSEKAAEDSIDELVYNTLETPRGGEYKLVLSDGTKIWMNAASKIIYPVEFIGDERRILLQGEAYFEVAEDKKKSFIVVLHSMEVKVLGTSFNIMAYQDENQIETTLVEGRVEININNESNDELELIPGEQARYYKESNELDVNLVDIYTFTAWKDGKYVIDNESLEAFMRRLGRWYNFEIEYMSDDIKEYHFSGTLDRYDNINVFLELISATTNIEFEINDNIIIALKADI